MAVQKTVLKIDIACQKCKTKVLKAVTIEGVNKIETDDEKGTVAVTGEADPYVIIQRARKSISCVGKFVEVVSIGPPPKPDDKKPEIVCCPCPPPPCQPVSYVVAYDQQPSCSIL